VTTTDGRRGWWEHPAAVTALILSVSLPMWFTSLPPLVDLLTHMARYRVQIDFANDPLLQRNWAFHWALIGNLGVDLLVWPLAKLIGLERAVWVIVTAIPPLLAWGMVRTARAIHGRVPGTALAALPFALAYPFQFGFVNFWLGLGLAFHAFAFWPRLSGRRHWLVFMPVGMAIWVCHAFAWGVLGVLAGTWELGEMLRQRPLRPLAGIGRIIARCAPLLVPIVPMLFWRSEGGGMAIAGWFHWTMKLTWLGQMLHDQSRSLDIVSVGGIGLALVMVLALTLLRERRLAIDLHLGLAGLVLALLYVVMPYQLFGSAYADTRLAPVAAIVLILAVRPSRGLVEQACAIAATALLALRLAVSADGFAAYDRDFTSHLRALDRIVPGSKVAALVRYPCRPPWRELRTQHLASLAVVRRHAFVNTHWNVSGAELLVPRGALGTKYNADPSQFVFDFRQCPADLRPRLAQKIAAVPRDVFDYVWVFGFSPASLPAYAGLRPLYADGASVLYAVEGRKGHR
jgi:hypothetical protein